LHGAWDPFLAHQTAFRSREDENEVQSKLNVNWVVDYWIAKGAQKSKILLGLALYGRSFSLIEPSKNELGQTAKGPGLAGTVCDRLSLFY
jgi:chitinase